jgi:hypothetical protein
MTMEEDDPQQLMRAIKKETELREVLTYVADFMKQVIENGNSFTKKHVFMVLEELDVDSVGDKNVGRYLKILIDELDIDESEYDAFCELIKN